MECPHGTCISGKCDMRDSCSVPSCWHLGRSSWGCIRPVRLGSGNGCAVTFCILVCCFAAGLVVICAADSMGTIQDIFNDADII